MSYFQVFRRFYRSGDSYIFTESVTVFDNFQLTKNFIENEKEVPSHLYKHLNTYVVQFEINQIYSNLQELSQLLNKSFKLFYKYSKIHLFSI
jgi:hypothetical protein